MKKIICLLLVMIAVQAGAQDSVQVSTKKFYFTARAGLNFADKTNTGGTFKTGLNFGMSAEYMFSSKFATELGVYYSMQGSQFRFANSDLNHNYVNIPLLAKYYAYRGLNFFAGPQLGIKANVNRQAFGNKALEDKLIDNDIVKAIDISAVIGAGYLLENGFFVSANVNWGLTTTAKGWLLYDGNYYPLDDKLFKNLVLQFNFGYRF